MSLAPPLVESLPEVAPPAGLTWLKFRRWAVKRLIVLAIFTTLYVLSIGPMWWTWYSGMYVSTQSDYWVIAFYEPLRLACHIEWIDRIVTAYIEWWIL